MTAALLIAAALAVFMCLAPTVLLMERWRREDDQRKTEYEAERNAFYKARRLERSHRYTVGDAVEPTTANSLLVVAAITRLDSGECAYRVLSRRGGLSRGAWPESILRRSTT